MSCHTKEELENMLFDVVNELNLSEFAIEQHGPLGTPPAALVRLVLDRKDMEIKMLRRGFVDVVHKATKTPKSFEERAEVLLGLLESDFGQSSRGVRIEAICCEFEAYANELVKHVDRIKEIEKELSMERLKSVVGVA